MSDKINVNEAALIDFSVRTVGNGKYAVVARLQGADEKQPLSAFQPESTSDDAEFGELVDFLTSYARKLYVKLQAERAAKREAAKNPQTNK